MQIVLIIINKKNLLYLIHDKSYKSRFYLLDFTQFYLNFPQL